MATASSPAPRSTERINRFCSENGLLLRSNPCISPDHCLSFEGLMRAASGADRAQWRLRPLPHARFDTAVGTWELLAEPESGDRAWLLTPRPGAPVPEGALTDGRRKGSAALFPASWENLLKLKNMVQEHDAASTIFPTAGGTLKTRSLGVGARHTTLHWPAVQWAMAQLGLSMHANQNSIPRELVYDVEVMLNNQLDSVPFHFIGACSCEGAIRARASRAWAMGRS